MHSSPSGAAALMSLLSFSSTGRFPWLKGARYSSMVWGLAAMVCALGGVISCLSTDRSVQRIAAISDGRGLHD